MSLPCDRLPCHNRHCPKCQTFTKVQWVEAHTAELLPVPYFHLVFTMPHDLSSLTLAHKRPLLTLLFNAARQTRVQFGQRHLGGQIGGTMVLHTGDQTLGAHVHCIMAAGARSANGARWLDADPRFLLPVRALSTVFRGQYAAVTEREALDMNVLGRDIIGLFVLIVDQPGSVICLLGQRHRYAIEPEG